MDLQQLKTILNSLPIQGAFSKITGIIDELSKKQGKPVWINVFNKPKKKVNKKTGERKEFTEPIMNYATKEKDGKLVAFEEFTPDRLKKSKDQALGMIVPVLEQLVGTFDKNNEENKPTILSIMNEKHQKEGKTYTQTVILVSDKSGIRDRMELSEIEEQSKDFLND